MQKFYLKVKKLHKDAKIIPPARDGDAGHDVCSIKSIEIQPHERYAIPLGIALEFPKGYVCIVTDKSGIASKTGLYNIGAVVDSCYRGEIHSILVNSTNQSVYVNAGQKVAQLIFYQCFTTNDIEFEDELSLTDRGSGKFGSTGV
jgi:dUTP pyrophosphatase